MHIRRGHTYKLFRNTPKRFLNATMAVILAATSLGGALPMLFTQSASAEAFSSQSRKHQPPITLSVTTSCNAAGNVVLNLTGANSAWANSYFSSYQTNYGNDSRGVWDMWTIFPGETSSFAHVDTNQVAVPAGSVTAEAAWIIGTASEQASYPATDCDKAAPTVAINTPTGSLNPTQISATATDNYQLAQVTANVYDKTGTALKQNCVSGPLSAVATYTLTCDTTGLADGSYLIMASATDQAGNTATTVTSAFAVDHSAPTITVKADSIGSTAHSTFSKVNFKLHDSGNIAKYFINGHSTMLPPTHIVTPTTSPLA